MVGAAVEKVEQRSQSIQWEKVHPCGVGRTRMAGVSYHTMTTSSSVEHVERGSENARIRMTWTTLEMVLHQGTIVISSNAKSL